MLIIAGAFGLADSWLLLVSPIIFGWFVVGAIGVFSLATGFGLMSGAEWAWSGAVLASVVNIFVGFIELLGAFNIYFVITGLTIWGELIGAGTLIASIIAIVLLYRPSVQSYYEQYT